MRVDQPQTAPASAGGGGSDLIQNMWNSIFHSDNNNNNNNTHGKDGRNDSNGTKKNDSGSSLLVADNMNSNPAEQRDDDVGDDFLGERVRSLEFNPAKVYKFVDDIDSDSCSASSDSDSDNDSDTYDIDNDIYDNSTSRGMLPVEIKDLYTGMSKKSDEVDGDGDDYNNKEVLYEESNLARQEEPPTSPRSRLQKLLFQKHRSSTSMATPTPSATPPTLSHSEELKNACARGSIPFLRPTKTKVKSGSSNNYRNNASSSMATPLSSSSSAAAVAAAAHSEELKNAITSHYKQRSLGSSTPFLRPTPKAKLGSNKDATLSPSSVSSSKLGLPPISPKKYSISKIKNAQQNNPNPKADEFFLEIKKWHNKFKLRDIEKDKPPSFDINISYSNKNGIVVDDNENIADENVGNNNKINDDGYDYDVDNTIHDQTMPTFLIQDNSVNDSVNDDDNEDGNDNDDDDSSKIKSLVKSKETTTTKNRKKKKKFWKVRGIFKERSNATSSKPSNIDTIRTCIANDNNDNDDPDNNITEEGIEISNEKQQQSYGNNDDGKLLLLEEEKESIDRNDDVIETTKKAGVQVFHIKREKAAVAVVDDYSKTIRTTTMKKNKNLQQQQPNFMQEREIVKKDTTTTTAALSKNKKKREIKKSKQKHKWIFWNKKMKDEEQQQSVLLNDPLLNNEFIEVTKPRTGHSKVGKREVKEITNHDGSQMNIIIASSQSTTNSRSATTITDDHDSVKQSNQIPTPVSIITVTTQDQRDSDVGVGTEDDHHREDHQDDSTDDSTKIQLIDGKNDEKHGHGMISNVDELCDDKLDDVTITSIGIEIEHLEEDKGDVKNENEKKNKYWNISDLFRTTRKKDNDEKVSETSDCGTTMAAIPLSMHELEDNGVRSNDENKSSSGVQQQTYNEKTLGLAQSSTKKPIKLPEISFEDRLSNFISLEAANREAVQQCTTTVIDDKESSKSTALLLNVAEKSVVMNNNNESETKETNHPDVNLPKDEEEGKGTTIVATTAEVLQVLEEGDATVLAAPEEEEDRFTMDASADKNEIDDIFTIDTPEEEGVFNTYSSADKDEVWSRDVKDVVKGSSPILGLVESSTAMPTISAGTDKISSVPESPPSCSDSKTRSTSEDCNESTTSGMTEATRNSGVIVPSMPTKLPSRVNSKVSAGKNIDKQQKKKRETDSKLSSLEMITLKNNTTDSITKKSTQRTKTATTPSISLREQPPQQKQRTQKDNIQCAKSIEKGKTKKSDRISTAKVQKSTDPFGNKDTEKDKKSEKKRKPELSSTSLFVGKDTRKEKRKERKAQMSTTLFGKDTEEVKYGGKKAELSTTLFGAGGNRQKNQQQQKRNKKKENKTSTERKSKLLSYTLFQNS